MSKLPEALWSKRNPYPIPPRETFVERIRRIAAQTAKKWQEETDEINKPGGLSDAEDLPE